MRITTCLAVLVVLSWTCAEGQEAKFTMTAKEKELLDLTNAERVKAELPALKPSPLLFKVARAHSANMAKQAKMEHELDGMNPFQRMKGAGYRYSWAGENIAAGDANIALKTMMKAWMESKIHRENILGKNFSEIGLGIIIDDKKQLYYTQVFGKPK